MISSRWNSGFNPIEKGNHLDRRYFRKKNVYLLKFFNNLAFMFTK